MTSEQAQALADRERPRLGVPPQAPVSAVERRYIELTAADRTVPTPVRDVLVWAVKFELRGGASWVEMAVDDRTGEIVRVLYSR